MPSYAGMPAEFEMIGYLFLSLALLAGATKGYCGKRSSASLVLASDAMMMNTVRMLLCILISAVLILVQGKWGQLAPQTPVLLICALSGAGNALFVVTWLMSVRRGAYRMVDVFLLIGVIIPLIACRFMYGEQIRPVQWIGILLLVVAGYIMCTYNVSLKGRMSPLSLLLLALCAIANGVADLSQKMFVRECAQTEIAVFNFYTYVFASVILLAFCVLFRAREGKAQALRSPLSVLRPILGYVTVMAACLFLNVYFKTAAARHLDAAALYPLSQGSAVIIAVLMSTFLFGERINLKGILGVALSFVALLFINVL